MAATKKSAAPMKKPAAVLMEMFSVALMKKPAAAAQKQRNETGHLVIGNQEATSRVSRR